MENLALKMKISVLWLFTITSMLGNAILVLMEPGVIEEVMTGVVEGARAVSTRKRHTCMHAFI